MYALSARDGNTQAMNNIALLLEEGKVDKMSEEASLLHPTLNGRDARGSRVEYVLDSYPTLPHSCSCSCFATLTLLL